MTGEGGGGGGGQEGVEAEAESTAVVAGSTAGMRQTGEIVQQRYGVGTTHARSMRVRVVIEPRFGKRVA